MEMVDTLNVSIQKNPNIGSHGLPEIFATTTIREHENSVDALAANPGNDAVFATGSHDRTIRIWDANKAKCNGIMKGHEKGVWSLVYDNTGKRILTASPDQTARIWDTKTGKVTQVLTGHSLFCYKAIFDSDGLNACTVGADKLVNYWDLRNIKAPVFSLEEKNCLINCDFLPNDQQIVTTSIAGEIAVFSVKRGQRVFYHDTMPGIIERQKAERAPLESKFRNTVDDTQNIPQEEKKVEEPLIKVTKRYQKRERVQKGGYVENKENDDVKEPSNIMFALRSVKNSPDEEGMILVGAEDQNITKYKFGYGNVEVVDKYVGHSMGIRSIELNKNCTKMMTGCEDHSIRIWDYKNCKSEAILSGHRDIVTGGIFLNNKTYVTASWDTTIKFWKV